MSGRRGTYLNHDHEDAEHDPAAQVRAAVLRVLEHVPAHGVVYWACEYVCPAADDGTTFYASSAAPGERDAVTLTFGCGEVSAELDVTVSPAAADGLALWLGQWQAPRGVPFHFPRAHLLWVGARTDPSRWSLVDETADQSITVAVSWPALGAGLASLVALYRPDVNVELDESWEHHRHPLDHVLSRSRPAAGAAPTGETEPDLAVPDAAPGEMDDDMYTLWVGQDGETSVKISGQVMDVLLDLEIEHQRFLGSLSARERAQYEYEEQWMGWTDGTFDPDGWAPS